MPVHRGIENNKHFYQWGQSGTKYYYIVGNVVDRQNAKIHAMKQGKAIQINQKNNLRKLV